MTSQDFCYWLQGYFELTPDASEKGFSAQQIKVIQEHLQLCFKKETKEWCKIVQNGSQKVTLINDPPETLCLDEHSRLNLNGTSFVGSMPENFQISKACWQNSDGTCVASC